MIDTYEKHTCTECDTMFTSNEELQAHNSIDHGLSIESSIEWNKLTPQDQVSDNKTHYTTNGKTITWSSEDAMIAQQYLKQIATSQKIEIASEQKLKIARNQIRSINKETDDFYAKILGESKASEDYDKDGYDKYGHDVSGYDKYGYGRDGFDRFGRDKDGYDMDGYDKDGYDNDGYDEFERDNRGNYKGESKASEFGDYDVTCSNCEGDGCDKCKNTGKITWTSVIPQKIEEGSIFNESLKTHNDYHRLINSVLTGEILHCSHCSKKFKAQESLDLHYNDVHIDQELRSLIGELKANEDNMDDIMWSNDHKGKVPQWKTPKNRPEWANKNGVSSMYDEIQNIAGADEDYEVDVDEYLKTGEPVQKLPTDKRSYDVELNTNMDDIKDDMDSIEATEWGYSNLSPEAETLQNLDYDLGGYTSYENNEDYKNAIKSKLTYPASQISGSVMGELEDINYHHFIKVLMELGAPKPTGESISNEVSWFECDDCKFIGMTHEDAMKHEQDTGHSILIAYQDVIPTFLKSEETELQLARESLTPLDKVDDKSNLTKAFESGASIEDIYSKVGDTTQERAGESELNDIYANVDVKLNLEKY